MCVCVWLWPILVGRHEQVFDTHERTFHDGGGESTDLKYSVADPDPKDPHHLARSGSQILKNETKFAKLNKMGKKLSVKFIKFSYKFLPTSVL